MKRLLLFLALLAAAPVYGTTYYISYSSGNNSNPGTAASPWKSHPYMHATGCTVVGNQPVYMHVAGDKFIFKGGDTWPAACFPMTIAAGGAAGSVDYYGTCTGQTTQPAGCTTFGTGRAVFDMQGQVPSNGQMSQILLSSVSYITIDNLELKNQQGGASTGGDPSLHAQINCGGTGNITVENSYLHGFTMTAAASTAPNLFSGAEGSIYGCNTADHMTVTDADGGEIGQPVGTAPELTCFRNVAHVTFSSCDTYANGVNGGFTVNNSSFSNGNIWIQKYGKHNNDVQDAGEEGMQFYNNVVHDSSVGQHVAVYPGGAIYNNVMWNIFNGDGCAVVDNGTAGDHNTPSATTVFYNNTLNCTTINSIQVHLRGDTTSLGTVLIKNNLFVNPNNPAISGTTGATWTASNNYPMPTAEANANGFTSASKFYPTGSDSNVKGAGANLFSSPLGTSLQLDAQGAPWFGGSYQARPASGAWDIGAYVLTAGGGAAAGLNPTSLNSGNVVANTSGPPQTITLSSSGSVNLSITSETVDLPWHDLHGGTCSGNPFTLPVGQNCTFQLVFSPTNTPGPRSGNFTLTTNAASSPNIVTLSGTATAFTVATPTASPGPGTFTSSQSVQLFDGTGSATICYTVNGDTPTASNPGTCDSDSGNEFTYSAPIPVLKTTTINAIGTLTFNINSAVGSFAYIISSGKFFAPCGAGCWGISMLPNETKSRAGAR